MSYKRYVFSDVHIGTNHEVNWYQKTVHGPLLQAAVEHILAQGKAVDGVDFAGDLVDQWAYPSNETTPSFAAIVAANPEIFGNGGLLPRLLDTVSGSCVWMPGNHDLTVQPAEIASIRGPSTGRSLEVAPFASRDYCCQHGNEFCYFNAADAFRMGKFAAPLGQLPFGYFMTRYASDLAAHMLKKEGKDNYAQLSESPEQLISRKGLKLATEILKRFILTIGDLNKAILQGLIKAFKVPILNVKVGDEEVTYLDIFSRYEDTLKRWLSTYKVELIINAVFGDFSGNIDWLGERLREDHHLVVLGHTHAAKYVPKKKKMYVNNGFFCPTQAEMKKGILPTFTEITVDDDGKATATILEVTSDGKVQAWSPKKKLRAPAMSKADRISIEKSLRTLQERYAEEGAAPTGTTREAAAEKAPAKAPKRAAPAKAPKRAAPAKAPKRAVSAKAPKKK